MKPLFCIISLLTFFGTLHLTGAAPQGVPIDKKVAQPFNVTNEDDYFLFKNTTLEVISDNSERTMENYLDVAIARKIGFHSLSRLKLNTSLGVQNYAYVSIPKNEQTEIKTFEITTTKPDGRILKFDSTQLLHSSVTDLDDKTNKLDITKYVIPGVEVGDEIEIDFSFEYTGNLTRMLYGNIFQNEAIPSLHSQYQIIVPYPYKIFFKCYNEFSPPTTEFKDLKAITTFAADSLVDIEDQTYACLHNELPYFYYSIEFGKDSSQFIKWKDFFNDFVNFLYPAKEFTYFDYATATQWTKKNLKQYKEKSNYEKFEILYSKLLNEYEIFDPYLETKSNTMFLNFKKKRVDRNTLFRLYAFILDYLKIDYYLCMGKDKYLGPIDKNFLRKNEITDYFLMYRSPDNQTTFVYPHELGKKYYLDEIPTYLNGTDVYIVKNIDLDKSKRENALFCVNEDSTLDIQQLRVDNTAYRDNFYHRNRMIKVDLTNNESQYFSTTNLSGCTSTDERHFYIELLKNKELYKIFIEEVKNNRDLFKIDSIYTRTERQEYPYKYSFGMKGKLGKLFNFVNDSTILISASDMMKNNKIEYDRQDRKMNILLYYPSSDIQDVIIEFDKPIHVINMSLLNKELSNSIGSFKYETTMIGDNKLRLTSTYIITKEEITLEDFNQLNELNDISDEMSSTKVIIGVNK